jgi:glycosyltransferase involved in cell wall biosynthesis
MRIAIEATLAQGNATGFGQYVVNLLREYAAMNTGHEFLLLHSTPEWTGPDFGTSFKPVSYYFLKQSLGIVLRLDRVLTEQGADIFHASCTTGMPPRIAIPSVSTIHDLYPLIFPAQTRFLQRFFFKRLIKWTALNSDFFICNSQFTASELQKYLHISAEKIAVTLLAPAVTSDVAPAIPTRERAGIICVGAIEPRKNQLLLFEAYRQALLVQPSMPDLTFIGPDRGDGGKLANLIENYGLAEKVRYLSYMPPAKIVEMYRHAALFVFPSNYEGFGIPLLEAMRYNLPILCSDIPVLREIGGDYPVFLQASSVNDWKMGLLDFCFGELKNSFTGKSPVSVLQNFSWERCAAQTLAIYEKLVNKVVPQTSHK